MPAISTAPNAIDRKLHRVVLESDSAQFSSFAALGRHIAQAKSTEFSYLRFGKLEFAGAEAIENYVGFARDVGLVDGDLNPSRPKREIRSLENFQHWLGDLTMQYLEVKNASMAQIEQAAIDLSQGKPSRLSTQENIRGKLESPPSLRNFRFSLKIIALLRSNIMSVASRRLVLIDGIVEG
jgi:hypothetical protein